MKRIFPAVLSMAVLMVLAGCAPSQPAAGAKKVIGVSMNALDEYRTKWLSLFTAKSEAKGYKVVSTDANNQVSKQISDVESLVAQKPDMIVITPIDTKGSVPAVEAANAANLPVVVVDFPVDTDKYDVQFTSDLTVNGTLLGDYIKAWVAAKPGRVAKVGYLIGANIPVVMGRRDGIFQAYPDAKLVAQATADWNADKAMKVTEDWLQAHPDINVIAAMNDEMAIGAIQALKAANKDLSQGLVLGVDGTANGQKYIRSGELNATVWSDLDTSLTKTVDVVDGLLNGKTFPKNVDNSAFKLVTKDNIDTTIK